MSRSEASTNSEQARERTDDASMQQQQPRRLKGLLALLPKNDGDASPYCYYPYNATQWKYAAGSRKRVRQRKRQSNRTTEQQNENSSAEQELEQKIELAEFLEQENEGSAVVVLFLMDPQQPYSIRLLEKLVDVVCSSSSSSSDDKEEEDHPQIRCLVATQGTSSNNNEIARSLLRHSGLCHIVNNNNNNTLWMSLAGFTSCPALAVANQQDGRKFTNTGEELGLEWNSVDHIRQHWRRQESCLTTTQKIQAAALFPTSCVIL